MTTKLAGSTSKRFYRLSAVLLAIVLSFYALNWAAYGIEYVNGRRAILKHYGGVAQAYTCGGAGASTASTFNIRPRAYLVPAEGISYAISTLGDGIAEGYVSPFGKVVETNPPQMCDLQ